MSAKVSASTAAEVIGLLESVGKSLPVRRHRVKGKTTTTIKLVPTGEIKVNAVLDSFVDDNRDASKGGGDDEKTSELHTLLTNKKIVLLFGSESHFLTKNFLVPKMALIYHHLTMQRADVEFLYVSLDDSKEAFDRFTKSHPWPCIPWEQKETRQALATKLHDPLKKPYGGASVVIVDTSSKNNTTTMPTADRFIVNRDAETKIIQTHDETGREFPWNTTAAEHGCAAATSCVFCTIL